MFSVGSLATVSWLMCRLVSFFIIMHICNHQLIRARGYKKIRKNNYFCDPIFDFFEVLDGIFRFLIMFAIIGLVLRLTLIIPEVIIKSKIPLIIALAPTGYLVWVCCLFFRRYEFLALPAFLDNTTSASGSFQKSYHLLKSQGGLVGFLSSIDMIRHIIWITPFKYTCISFLYSNPILAIALGPLAIFYNMGLTIFQVLLYLQLNNNSTTPVDECDLKDSQEDIEQIEE